MVEYDEDDEIFDDADAGGYAAISPEIAKTCTSVERQYNLGMAVAAEEIAKLILEELRRLKAEAQWGVLVVRVALKNGDAHEVGVVNERTFRALPPEAPPRA